MPNISEYESFNSKEATEGKILPEFEELFPAGEVVPGLENMLLNGTITAAGVRTAEQIRGTEFFDNPHIRRVLDAGLCDPMHTVRSLAEWKSEGKLLADTAVALLTGRAIDRIDTHTTQNTGSEADLNTLKSKIADLPIQPGKSYEYVDDDYIKLVRRLFIKEFSGFLDTNLNQTLQEIQNNPDDPWNTVYSSLNAHLSYGLPRGLVVPEQNIRPTEENVYSFIQSGSRNMINISYANIEVTPKRAKTDLARVRERENKLLTPRELQNIFLYSGNVGIDLAHIDIDLFRSQLLEIVNINFGPLLGLKQDDTEMFTFKPEAFKLIDANSERHVGILIRDEEMKQTTEDTAREKIFRFQSRHPEQIRPEPRLIYLCPGYAKRSTNRPRAIPYLHKAEATLLDWLNEHLEEREKIEE